MDPTTLIGKAPDTTEPITWIAMLLVVVVVSTLIWQLRAASIERTEARADSTAALAAFRNEMASQRTHDAEQTQQIHQRVDGLSVEVRRLVDARS